MSPNCQALVPNPLSPNPLGPAPTQSSPVKGPISSKGTGADTKILWATHHPTTHPITLRRSGWKFMVQREAPSTPECQEGVPSQGGQHREEHSVVQHVQVEHY